MPVLAHIVADIDPSRGQYRLIRGYFTLMDALHHRNRLNENRPPEPEQSPAIVHTVEIE